MNRGSGGRRVPLIVLVLAVIALLSSVTWAFAAAGTGSTTVPPGRAGGYHMPMGPGGMMPGASGARPVRDMNGARRAAQRFADGWGRGLRVGEVMQFSNGFYAVLLDPSGEGATEVLVDPASGAVQLEHGPAMMWNTSYGMMPDRQQQAAPAVSAERAQVVADRWLKQNRAGLKAADPVAFPGYYTFHTLRGDQVVGMMSVNAYNGAVWYHTWHGTFLRMQEPRHS